MTPCPAELWAAPAAPCPGVVAASAACTPAAPSNSTATTSLQPTCVCAPGWSGQGDFSPPGMQATCFVIPPLVQALWAINAVPSAATLAYALHFTSTMARAKSVQMRKNTVIGAQAIMFAAGTLVMAFAHIADPSRGLGADVLVTVAHFFAALGFWSVATGNILRIRILASQLDMQGGVGAARRTMGLRCSAPGVALMYLCAFVTAATPFGMLGSQDAGVFYGVTLLHYTSLATSSLAAGAWLIPTHLLPAVSEIEHHLDSAGDVMASREPFLRLLRKTKRFNDFMRRQGPFWALSVIVMGAIPVLQRMSWVLVPVLFTTAGLHITMSLTFLKPVSTQASDMRRQAAKSPTVMAATGTTSDQEPHGGSKALSPFVGSTLSQSHAAGSATRMAVE